VIDACHFALIHRNRNGQAFAATQRADDLRKFTGSVERLRARSAMRIPQSSRRVLPGSKTSTKNRKKETTIGGPDHTGLRATRSEIQALVA
jgi:hypothetical protein